MNSGELERINPEALRRLATSEGVSLLTIIRRNESGRTAEAQHLGALHQEKWASRGLQQVFSPWVHEPQLMLRGRIHLPHPRERKVTSESLLPEARGSFRQSPQSDNAGVGGLHEHYPIQERNYSYATAEETGSQNPEGLSRRGH
jgi:hypothetical protein